MTKGDRCVGAKLEWSKVRNGMRTEGSLMLQGPLPLTHVREKGVQAKQAIWLKH